MLQVSVFDLVTVFKFLINYWKFHSDGCKSTYAPERERRNSYDRGLKTFRELKFQTFKHSTLKVSVPVWKGLLMVAFPGPQ